ncbi:MAG TPA: GDP-mannose 4,6-dehydratase, partial [Saprospiraceae bacterium]|nr:GDP-mannose 4,6-dehydratase [Saprospiraceae bacterium]
ADHIMHDQRIDVYNNGQMSRDFTYIDDIVTGIEALLDHAPDAKSGSPHRIVNIGRSQPVNLLTFIELLEKYLGKQAIKRFLPMQQGDVEATYADTSALQAITGYTPQTDLEEGIRKFVEWYKVYHQRARE